MAHENMEDLMDKFPFESETESEREKKNMSNKLVKMGGIMMLCFLLLNFVLVFIAMNRTAEISSAPSTKIDKQLGALENENGELKKSHEELKEQFESFSKKLDQFKNNISSSPGVSPLTPEPENEDKGNSTVDLESITSCSIAMEIFPSPPSKKQAIYPHGNRTSVEVLCDFETDGGGWTIIQKRSSGPKDEFQKNWNEYKNGFGSLEENFWIGLENIHALTQNGDQELRIELEDFEGENRWAKYSNFSISDSSDFYRLALSGFYENSTLQDSMINSPHFYDASKGMRFSTKDEDNDENSAHNCAVSYGGGGGWWFNKCGYANLNGLYHEQGETVAYKEGIRWDNWKGEYHSFAKTEMKIRTRK